MLLLDYAAGLLALGYFLIIAAATKQHFVSESYSLGMNIISLLSLVGILTFALHAFIWSLDHGAVAILGTLLALLLFRWAVKHSSNKKLSLAFDPENHVDGIIMSGPWAFIRHPFYTSYIVFWTACAVASLDLAMAAVALALAFIYLYSARQEEKRLQKSALSHEYSAYREKTGFLLPKLMSR